MQKRRLGRSDLELTVLTMGCWQAGKDSWSNVTDEDSIAALRAAFDSGINCFDTAEGYGGGHSERIVAQALEGHREEVILATKVGASNLAPEKVATACEGSLERLSTDYIDLYQIHWPSGAWGSSVVPIEDTMAALLKLKEQGKIRAIVSRTSKVTRSRKLSTWRIDSLQPPYSLFWRSFEENGTFETCVKHDVSIIPYSPLAQAC
jgi:aryl-alcohol dehydrogenase-like predicted oxidoreductase